MPRKQDFSKILKRMLATRATAEETESLLAAGFNLRAPTKQAVIMAALYKKAAAGDLSAIKELRAILGDTAEAENNTAVVIIDNLKNNDC